MWAAAGERPRVTNGNSRIPSVSALVFRGLAIETRGWRPKSTKPM